MQKNNFIIFSSIDWSTHWQLHHQLTMSIIKSGGRVLFVENTGVRSPKIKDISRIKSRIKSRMNSTYGFNSIEKNLTIYTPLFVPYPYNRLSIFINTLFIYKSIVRWMRLVCFYKPIVISFLPTPSTQNIIKKINPILTVYYCVDDMSRSLSNPNKLKRSEKFFFLNADLVFTTSHKIYNYALQFSDSVYNFPSGVDRKKFPLGSKESIMVPEDIEHITKPIIGYIGAIGDVFDKKLILELANTLPHINILIVGPVHTDISKLENI